MQGAASRTYDLEAISAHTLLTPDKQLPAGAHNTIVTSRAGKDLVSCLVSGLLTIGPRFGGAIDDAARYFQDACDRGLDADEFVEEMKKKGIRVPGIGHRIKSKVGFPVSLTNSSTSHVEPDVRFADSSDVVTFWEGL